jgi:hypothetical protein
MTSVGLLVAAVAGDTGTWTVYRPSHGSGWHCTCPAPTYGRTCAHQTAVALVAG